MEHEGENNGIANRLPVAKPHPYDCGSLSSHPAQPSAGNRGWPLVNEESWESDFNFIDSGDEKLEIQKAACQRSIDFQKSQYLRYLHRVQESGIEPKELLSGLEVAESGPTAPPLDFWCLIAARDRLIVESNFLLERIRSEQKEALKYLSISGSFGLIFAGGLQAVSIPWISILNIPSISYGIYHAAKLVEAWRHEHELELVVQRATNWELVDNHKGRLV